MAEAKLHFLRYEFKYVLPLVLRNEIEKELGYFMELDPFVVGKPDSRYFVRSLYFENETFSNYYQKIDGQKTRSKFRIRTYTDRDDEPSPVFLEIKGRRGGVVFKHRSALSGADEDHPDQGYSTDWIVRNAVRTPVIDQFEYDVLRKRLKPRMLIDYSRRPYVSRYDPEFRITFDDRLRAWDTARLHPKRAAQRRCMPGYTILEVKFRYHVPAWFHRIIQSYELRRVSVSKFCEGVQAFGLVPHLE